MTIEFQKTTITYEVIHEKGWSPEDIEDAVHQSEHADMVGVETQHITEDLTLDQTRAVLKGFGEQLVAFTCLLDGRPSPAIQELSRLFYEMKDEAAKQGLSELELLWWPHKPVVQK